MKNTIALIEKEKVILILRGVTGEALLRVAKAAYDGGIRLLECTYDASGKTPDETVAENIRMLSAHFGEKMHIGAGTVLTPKQVELTKAAGGKFIISPDTNPAIIAKTKAEGLVSIPGALTPTEAATAHNCGADFVKMFPISVMGPKYLKDLHAPLCHIRFLAVGGVNTDNMAAYFEAGACGIGIGSDIANKKFIEAGDFAAIEKAARRYSSRLQQGQ